MIKEAILANKEDHKLGIGRQTIKKYINAKYPETTKIPPASFNNHIARALTHGTEKGVFVLPKGPSGKVKLAPSKAKTAAAPAAAKPKAAAAAPKKKAPAAAKKPAAKKVSC